MFPKQINDIAIKIIDKASAKGITISTAESCTGGLIIAALTEINGSSAVVERGFITYTNQSKEQMVNVSHSSLEKYGAVSEETVKEMAQGAKINAGTTIAVSVSGIAGPTGGSAEKPVGLVHWALYDKNNVVCDSSVFTGDRSAIRLQAVEAVLNLILTHLKTA